MKQQTIGQELKFSHFKNGIPHYEHTGLYITGIYGCKCHPFTDWPECDHAHTQSFKCGDSVQHRCNGKTGVITKVVGNYFYHVSTIGLEHAAQLKPWI